MNDAAKRHQSRSRVGRAPAVASNRCSMSAGLDDFDHRFQSAFERFGSGTAGRHHGNGTRRNDVPEGGGVSSEWNLDDVSAAFDPATDRPIDVIGIKHHGAPIA